MKTKRKQSLTDAIEGEKAVQAELRFWCHIRDDVDNLEHEARREQQAIADRLQELNRQWTDAPARIADAHRRLAEYQKMIALLKNSDEGQMLRQLDKLKKQIASLESQIENQRTFI